MVFLNEEINFVIKVEFKEITKSAKIIISYETSLVRGENDFETLKELKTWLESNPVIAQKLGYIKKRSNQLQLFN